MSRIFSTFGQGGNNIHRSRSDTKRHTHLSDGYCSLPLESIGKLAFLYHLSNHLIPPHFLSPSPHPSQPTNPLLSFSFRHRFPIVSDLSSVNPFCVSYLHLTGINSKLSPPPPPPPLPYSYPFIKTKNILYRYQVTIAIG